MNKRKKSKQNRLREILKNVALFGWNGKDTFDDEYLKTQEQSLHTLFREKAKQTAHESVPRFVMDVNEGVKKVIKWMHKSIDKRFDEWGKE